MIFLLPVFIAYMYCWFHFFLVCDNIFHLVVLNYFNPKKLMPFMGGFDNVCLQSSHSSSVSSDKWYQIIKIIIDNFWNFLHTSWLHVLSCCRIKKLIYCAFSESKFAINCLEMHRTCNNYFRLEKCNIPFVKQRWHKHSMLHTRGKEGQLTPQ